MRSNTRLRLLLAATSALPTLFARATDLRLDVATYNNNGLDTVWFGDAQMQYLNFPSANGHGVEQGGSTHQSLLTAQGNTLGVYYDTFHSLYSPTESPTAAVSTIQSWIKSHFGGSTETNDWLVLNEVDGSTWNGTNGAAYRTWLVDTMSALHSAGYNKIILYSSDSLATKSTTSTWQQIGQYAYLGTESYVDGQVVLSDNFSVSKLQAIYQQRYNNWTQDAGLPASKVIVGEHFSVNKYDPSFYWGADGISGTQWQMAIEARDIAIHNIPFAGFIGYAWDKDAQATGDPATDLAAQISYEKAYASTLVAQSELPAWTGNDGTTSWNDYLNWTGGLPSTTAAPFPLLATTNPNLPKQTTANFLAAIKANTTITLDGNQSVTNLSFGSPYSYTIAAGTGGSLTFSGTGASMSVTSGSHTISANAVLAGATAANLTGSLTLSGGVTNNGVTLTKSGGGTLTISGPQGNAVNSAISVGAGTLNLNTDAGSATSSTLAFSQSGGQTNFNSSQHLESIALSSGGVAMKSGSLLQIASFLSGGGGQLFAHTGGISIDNPSSSALTLTGGPHDILLDFDTPGNLSGGPYWGLRWQGDHVGVLKTYLNEGAFSGNGEILVENNPANFNINDLTVGTMEVNGVEYSYVGFANTVPEPSALGWLLLTPLLRRRRRHNVCSHRPS